MNESGAVIDVEHLTRYYGTRAAVDDISFSVGRGEIVGFLGPNGAGKTTTMRILTGYLMPTRGRVRIGGYDMATRSRECRRLIGYLPESVPLYPDMTVRGLLLFLARLRGLGVRNARSRVDQVIEGCQLGEYADTLVARLSRGFRQRVGLAQAIVHDPATLVLDEATVGIDPVQVKQTRSLIREFGKDRTVLLSTHILSEVSAICSRVIIIDKGRIAAMDSIGNLSGLLARGGTVRVKVNGPPEPVGARIGALPGVLAVRYEAPFHYVEYAPETEPQAGIAESIVRAGWTLLALEQVDMSLEDIFLKLTAEQGGTKQ